MSGVTSNTARRVRKGAALPATCSPGECFLKDSGGSEGLYICITANTWLLLDAAAGDGTVTSVSVASANGLGGSVANPTTTPAITLSTSVTGILKGDGTAISAAAAGTDYLAPTGNGSGLTGLTKSQVGLGSVDDTSDATKNTAAATLTNKTLTAPVINAPTGIVKGDVGLSSVDNTSDAAKPVSTAQQTALDLKQNLLTNSAGLRAALSDELGTGAALFDGATPTGLVLTNATGLPIGSGVSGLGANVATFLATPSSANLAAAVSDETGSGAVVFGTTPTLNQPNIVGTTTNNNASAGSVGEYVSSSVAAASAVSLTTSTTTNITSISLPAGDWDVYGSVTFQPNTATTVTFMGMGVTSTSATLDFTGADPENSAVEFNALVLGSTYGYTVISRRRFSLSGTTTIYLAARPIFGVSTMAAFGFVGARRVR